jgi:hypothetical protein
VNSQTPIQGVEIALWAIVVGGDNVIGNDWEKFREGFAVDSRAIGE